MLKPAIAVRPLPIPSQSNFANFVMAMDKINTATERAIIVDDTFCNPLKPSLPMSFSNIDIDANNSANRAVIAPKDDVSFSEGINDNTSNDAASMAIAVAIVFNVFAFMDSVNAFNESPTPSRIPFILSIKPAALSVIPDNDFMNLAINAPMATNRPPFIKSKIPL